MDRDCPSLQPCLTPYLPCRAHTRLQASPKLEGNQCDLRKPEVERTWEMLEGKNRLNLTQLTPPQILASDQNSVDVLD
jgi:hypothetical protein